MLLIHHGPWYQDSWVTSCAAAHVRLAVCRGVCESRDEGSCHSAAVVLLSCPLENEPRGELLRSRPWASADPDRQREKVRPTEHLPGG